MNSSRRSRSYFSKFAVASDQLHLGLPTSKLSKKSKSAENIVEVEKPELIERPYYSNSKILSASTEQLALQVEEELNLKVQSLTDIASKTCKKITVPVSVKYAVTLDRPAQQRNRTTMASKCAANTDLLDQTLLSIRINLNSLNSDRVEMESKMEELITGIKSLGVYCCNQQRLHLSQNPASSIRRVRSSTTPSMRPDHLIANTTRQHSTDSSQEQLDDANTDLSQGASTQGASTASTLSVSSQNNLLYRPHRTRCESAAASLKYSSSKSKKLPELSIHNNHSLENMSTTIHELPESPRSSFSSSNSSLHSYSIFGTTPRNSYSYKRSFSASSPPSSVHNKNSIMTSTPNVSHNPDEGYYHTLPNMAPSHRNSLPESIMMATTIPEDEVDCASYSDNLSQLSLCTDEGSPKGGSTLLVRRSSLTGQLEHYRKPARLLVKTNPNSKDYVVVKSPKLNAGSVCDVREPTCREPDFRSLRKRKTSRRISIILPGIETAV